MPLIPSTRATVSRKLEEYEGRYNHLYLDSVGKVTVGVGHMIPSRASMATVLLYTMKGVLPGAPASLAEKQAEFDLVAKQPRNYRASWYKQHTKLVMKEPDINAQRDRHIDSFYKELVSIYSRANGFKTDFDAMLEEVQLALFDMIFNLGATKLRAQFILFNGFVKQEQWLKAANECNRPDVSAARNNYVKGLLLATHRKSSVAVP